MLPTPSRDTKRKWYRLAIHHLRIAKRLTVSGLADGAMFHVYHAYECMLTAFIVAKGYKVPRGGVKNPKTGKHEGSHIARFIEFDKLADRTQPYYRTHNKFKHISGIRNNTLYYDERTDKLPCERFTQADVLRYFPQIHHFSQLIWQEIQLLS